LAADRETYVIQRPTKKMKVAHLPQEEPPSSPFTMHLLTISVTMQHDEQIRYSTTLNVRP